MNILIIGGGNVGYYLAKSLLHAGTHEIKIIEKERCKCAYVADRLDISVFRGDGTDIVLARRPLNVEKNASHLSISCRNGETRAGLPRGRAYAESLAKPLRHPRKAQKGE